MLKASLPVPGTRRHVVLALPGGHQGSDGTPYPGLWLQHPEGSKLGGKFGRSICSAAVPAPADLPAGASPTSAAAMSPLCFSP